MNSTLLRVAVAAFAFASPCTLSAAGIPASLSIFFNRIAQPIGAPLYEMQVQISGAPLDTIVGPSGRLFQTFSLPLTNLSESQVFSELVGNWRIDSVPLGPPGQPPEVHEFSIGPLSVADIFTTPPTIVSPTSGSTVPSEFLLSWEWPVGTTPPGGRAARASGVGNGPGFSANFGTFNTSSVPVAISFPVGATQANFNFFAGSFQSFNNLVSPVTTAVPNPRLMYSASLGYRNLSVPVNVTVLKVPEPATLALIGSLGAPIAFALARRRREKGDSHIAVTGA